MIDELSRLLAVNGFLPHGYCISWSPPLVLTYVVSDLLIFLAYFSMPLAIIYFARRRKDFPFRWLLWLFAAFIMVCGATHLMGAILLWQPLYVLDAALKVVTALVSVFTALTLWPLIPYALKLPSPDQLRRSNEQLLSEIVERKRVENALRLAKEAAEESLQKERMQLAAIVEFSADAIVGKTLDGVITSWNKGAENIYGYAAGEMLGRSGSVLLPPAGIDQEEKALAAICRGEAIQHFETQHVHKDGRRIDIAITVSPIRDMEGRIVGASEIARDIGERVKADADLRIAAVAFDSRESLMLTDADGMILRVNRAFIESTGYSAEELVGQNPRMLKSDRHDADFYRRMWESIVHSGGWQGEIWDRRKNGEVYPKWLIISAVKGDHGAVTHYIGSHLDISERKQAEERINELAFFDPLTHLPNRTLLLDRLKQAMTSGNRDQQYGAVLFIDLDHFKTLNDTLGHDKGDLLLQQVAQRLAACVRESDTVARLGGDEFVVVLGSLSGNPEEAATQTEAVGEKILAALNQTYQLGPIDHRNSASIGATLFVGHETSIDDLLRQADLAMYKAKETGRNAFCFFDPAMQTVVVERAALEKSLRGAIQARQFVLHYQAQVLDGGRVLGAEALVRWQHPERGMVAPAQFIPLAEESGLIVALGNWVLEEACSQLARWASRPELASLTLAVNVSAKQFHKPDFVATVLAALRRTRANPQRLKLELTESLLVDNVEDIIDKMLALKERGVGFVLDDFGTGYSSLSYLKRLPLDQLKIDQSFVRDVLVDPNDAAIAGTIVTLARSLGLGVIAEGVETEAQRDFLANAGCRAYQGYFFSRPLAIDDFELFVLGA